MRRKWRGEGVGNVIPITTVLILLFAGPFPPSSAATSSEKSGDREVIGVEGGPDDLVWVVQLSDLHFSVHHPERAKDFREIVGPTLSFIKPSLVMLTGDLTDGKSKDLLVMKQIEAEWIEYQNVMRDVIKRSGLNEKLYYDVRGNHDNFGVPEVGGPSDFFSKYSISAKLQRNGKVNSITVQTSKRKLLFVGFDSTMSSGLRGPTNLFGHPTNELLSEISSHLSQWDSEPVTKLLFGHFPLSFSSASSSGDTLKDIFLGNSVSTYLCGHLHTKFGENLKRQHHSRHSKQLIQLNGHQNPLEASNCSNFEKSRRDEFWELEMGDWRRSRMMRILAIDRGRISFVDVDFKLGAKKTIILPIFPLDSRFASYNYKCGSNDLSSYGLIRALVFSSSPIVSVVAKIYDSSTGNLIVVMDTEMTKLDGARGDLYVAPWNIEAFEDPSPNRFLLKITSTDIMGRSVETDLRAFSVIGIPRQVPWSMKEFFVMGCQWDSLYYPIIFGFYILVLPFFVIPKVVPFFSRRQNSYKNFKAEKTFKNGVSWMLIEFYNVRVAWLCMTIYLFTLALCPWFYGVVSTEGGQRAYMTYRGWVSSLDNLRKIEFVGHPDVMVVVLPHLFLVVLPAIVVMVLLAAENGVYCDYLRSVSSKKKKDDSADQDKGDSTAEYVPHRRWFRKLLLVVSLAILFKHFMICVALTKAYEMNPFIHFPLYSFAVPLMLAYTIWKTESASNGIIPKK